MSATIAPKNVPSSGFSSENKTAMRGLVYGEPGMIVFKEIPKPVIEKHFKLDEIIKAYEVFGNPAKERALKIILTNK